MKVYVACYKNSWMCKVCTPEGNGCSKIIQTCCKGFTCSYNGPCDPCLTVHQHCPSDDPLLECCHNLRRSKGTCIKCTQEYAECSVAGQICFDDLYWKMCVDSSVDDNAGKILKLFGYNGWCSTQYTSCQKGLYCDDGLCIKGA